MKLSKKLMNALSKYWRQKFGSPAPARVDADKLLAKPTGLALNDPDNIFGIVHSVSNGYLRCIQMRLKVLGIGGNTMQYNDKLRKQIKDLTLMLLYLNSFDDDVWRRRMRLGRRSQNG